MEAVAENLFDMGYAFLREGQADQAILVLEKARHLKPESDKIIFLLGNCYRETRQYEEAKSCFRQLIDLHPQMPIGHYQYAMACLDNGEIAEGTHSIMEAVRLGKLCGDDVSQILCALGFAFLKAEKTDDAMRLLTNELEKQPEQSEYRRLLWRHHIQLGETELASFQAALALGYPGSPALLAEARRYIAICAWNKESRKTLSEKLKNFCPPTAKPRFVLGIALWGEAYVQMCGYLLRCLAASGNLPALARHFDVHLVFVTTTADRARLENTGWLDLFDGIAAIDFIDLPQEIVVSEEYFSPSEHMYVIYSMAMHLCIEYARLIGAAVCPFVSDALLSDGSMASVGDLALAGAKAVFATGLVCDSDTILPAVDNNYGSDRTIPISISGSDLMRLGDGYLNDIFTSCIVTHGNRNFSLPPGVLFWRTPEGLVGHGFNLHPVYIAPELLAGLETPVFSTIDGHLPRVLLPNPEDWKQAAVIADSDQFGLVTLAPPGKQFCKSGRPFDIEREKDYTANRWQVAPVNMWLFRQPLLFRHVRVAEPSEYDPKIAQDIEDAFIAHRPADARGLQDD